MDLAEFDPFHPSNGSGSNSTSFKPSSANQQPTKITTTTNRLFSTPPPNFNSSLTSSRLNSNTPPPPPPLPTKLVSKDPLNSFDLLSFSNDNKPNNISIQPSILAHNIRQESTLRDLNRDPWSVPSIPSSSSTTVTEQPRKLSFLIPPPGSFSEQTTNRNLNNLNSSQASSSSTLPKVPSKPSHSIPFNSAPNSKNHSAFSTPSDSFQNFNNIETNNSGIRSSTTLSNPDPPPSVEKVIEEEDWWSGFQSANGSLKEAINGQNIVTSSKVDNNDWESSHSTNSDHEKRSKFKSLFKGKERAFSREKEERQDSFDSTGREEWNYDASSVDAIQPIKLIGVNSDDHRALTEDIAEGIRPNLPPRLRVSRKWNLIYSLDKHGVSLPTMYERMAEDLAYSDGGVVLVVKDGSGSIFGAYVNQGLQELNHCYGDGSCFLWKATPFAPTDFRVGSSIKTFNWTGKNDYIIFSDSKFISVGGGNGKFGFWVDSRFDKGFSARCPCFDNEPLTAKYENGVLDGEEAKFDVVMFECWAVDK